MDYFYDKINLLRDEDVNDNDVKKSIWRGLPAEFQVLFDYDETQTLPLETISTRFLKKDPSFRKAWIRNHRMRNQQNQQNQSSHSERHDRSCKAPETSHSVDKAKDNKSI
jgi:hypothetical protein